MRGIARTLLYSCKKATELIEKKQVTRLSLIERVRLNSHLSLCESCSVYGIYSAKMNIMLQSHLHSKQHNSAETLTNEALKERLLKLL